MRPIYFLPVLFLCLLGYGTCAPAQEQEEEPPVAEQAAGVIQRAIAAHGMTDLNGKRISFAFRERDYGIELQDGRYRYTRSFVDSTGQRVRDELTNEGLRRFRQDSAVGLSVKDSTAYAASVNSVRYFFLLPFGLEDPAVQAELLDTVGIGQSVYDRVRVTFSAQGGGTDHEDIYHYFFDREDGQLDYLAYTFETDGGGIRFREAINKRRVGDVVVQDYVNYGLDGADRDIATIARRYEAGELPELSRIENTSVRIK